MKGGSKNALVSVMCMLITNIPHSTKLVIRLVRYVMEKFLKDSQLGDLTTVFVVGVLLL